jgi:hypothetical protein
MSPYKVSVDPLVMSSTINSPDESEPVTVEKSQFKIVSSLDVMILSSTEKAVEGL